MRAWTYSTRGTPRQVLSIQNIDFSSRPVSDEVLIKIAYAGLTPGDAQLMRLVPTILRPKNTVPAYDYSGTIAARGPNAPSHLQVGLPVYGTLARSNVFKGKGALADYMLVSTNAAMVAPVPTNVSLRDACTLGSAGYMALLIIKHGGLKPNNGYRVLVNGASGGIGSMAVQAIRGLGVREIVAICSAPNAELVKRLGADRVVDYRAHPVLHEYLAETFGDDPFDFILDTVGVQSLYVNSPSYLKRDGVYENVGDFENRILLTSWYRFTNLWWPTILGGTPRRYVTFGGDFYKDICQELEALVAEGKLNATVDREVAFEEAIEAIELVNSRRAKGRVVVKVNDVQ